MTLLQKIQNLTWWNEIIKLKEILTEIFSRILILESTPSEDSRPYKVYTATISQLGTANPVAIIKENTFSGDIVWTRVGVGAYEGVLTSIFLTDNTPYLSISSNYELALNSIEYMDSDTVFINTGTFDGTSNDSFNYISIEIRVYN